ncbi:hypothetical protein AAFF_G00209410 [Aldrovandia affinis]|uniref:Poly [ADP-ribose] polymerase n=1 Tax=Aldrovandia affinis TaxID=143900 RepID=A0AAD7SWA9_9TELE|nr:hypothetical protein AAFF_G00209410 [Aldrovandia affinis]
MTRESRVQILNKTLLLTEGNSPSNEDCSQANYQLPTTNYQLPTTNYSAMPVFENCSVVLEVKDLSFKEKKKLKLAITDNGGSISYVINKQCTHVITNNLANVSSNRQRSIQKLLVPVVGVEYVSRCLEEGTLLSVKEYSLLPLPSTVTPNPPSQTWTSLSPHLQATVVTMTGQSPVEQKSGGHLPPQVPAPPKVEKDVVKDAKGGTSLLRMYNENDSDLPMYPSNFEVAKYSIFERVSPGRNWSVLELQSCRGQAGQEYRVVRYWSEGQDAEAVVKRDKLAHCSTSEQALQTYEALKKELHVSNFQLKTALPPQPLGLGSSKLHQLLLEERMNSSAISQEAGVFVELLWAEALGCLANILRISIMDMSLNDVSRAEGLLLQVQKGLKEGREQKQLQELMGEFYTLLPHKEELLPTTCSISHKLDLCQLIRDMLKVSEATLWSPAPSCLGKYRALRCSIDCVPTDSPEFLSVSTLLRDSPVQIQQVFRVSRTVELQMFQGELGNVRPLLHSSAPSSFVGILSRGLLLPRVGVEHHGIERTDIGNLGGGIYFSDSLSTSLKYSKPGTTDGTRLLLVCDVALGRCKDLHKKDISLNCAPEGYHSVHGVQRSPKGPSDFEDEEYVVYHSDQVQMKYVVQFSVEDEPVKTFQPTIDVSSDVAPQPLTSDLLAEGEEDSVVYKNPLEDVTAGLLDNNGQPLPLQAVHVKCKLMDLLTQVIIFQSYTNLSEVPIEAKYVFPLDESAAVCGFEAFINGKHVVGQVKEKEQARKEYRQAIEKGHGAYLMDQDAPDVFTISVGNLPSGATVLIKVTYVTELIVRAGSLIFSLPGSVAPWQQSKALNQRTQVSVEKVCVNELQTEGLFTLDMSIEMPYEILDLSCVTHRIQIKKTDCKAVVRMLPGQTLGPDGFQLSFTLSQVHLPRMWVENHPDKDSQACMLVFYPHFDPSGGAGPGDGGRDGDVEVVILLDTSESMRGVAMQDARRIAVQILKALDHKAKVNIISFGTDHKELFLSSQACSMALQPAMKFAMSSPAVGGSTELWRPLRSLSLLPPSSGIRNLLLISDGHVLNEALTLNLVRENIQHSRVFTCGVSTTANRHMLRALAQAGGGAYEFFDTKTKHTWVEKVSSQVRRMSCPGCSSVSVKWQQFSSSAAPPIQAPTQLHALFSDCHTLVYGFVPHCTQATLSGKLSEQEIETMVSTTELQKTTGTFLHKLTARAVIRDHEGGSLHPDEAEHEVSARSPCVSSPLVSPLGPRAHSPASSAAVPRAKKEELKSYIIQLSKEYSIVTQYTSFVAIEERDTERSNIGFTDIPRLISEEDVDFLPYVGWEGEPDEEEIYEDLYDELGDDSDGFAMFDSLCGKQAVAFDVQPYCGYEDLGLMSAMTDYEPYPVTHQAFMQPQPQADSIAFPHLPPPPPPSGPASQMHRRNFKPRVRMTSPLFGAAQEAVASASAAEHKQAQDAIWTVVQQQQQQQCAAFLDRDDYTFDQRGVSVHGFRDSSFSFLAAPPTPPAPPSFTPFSQPRSISEMLHEDEIADARPVKFKPGIVGYSWLPPPPLPPQNYFQKASDVSSRDSPVSTRSRFICQASLSSDSVGSLMPRTKKFSSAGAEFVEGATLLLDTLTVGSVGAAYGDRPLSWASRAPSLFTPVSLQGPPSRATPSKKHGFLSFGATNEMGSSQGKAVKQKELLETVRYELKARRRLCGKARGARSKSRGVSWEELFDLQHQDGYWECTGKLGSILRLDIDFFANVFLKQKGIISLGVRAHADILKLVATLLVLQLMRVMGLAEGSLLRTLFRLKDPNPPPSLHGEAVKRAVEWVSKADRQYPCICSRLEFGWDWESATRQLLGVDPPHSPLRPILERTAGIQA